MTKTQLFHTDRQQRVLALLELLRTRGGLTRKVICERLRKRGFSHVSQRTFMRDIDYLRKDERAPVGYKITPGRQGGDQEAVWFLRDQSWTLGEVQMTEATLFALFVAQRLVERYAGSPVADELKRAFDKLGEALNRKISVQPDMLASISFAPDTQAEVNASVWGAVLLATTQRKVLTMAYSNTWGVGAGKHKERRIHPYHIVNLQGTWYLLGSHSEDDLSLRQYVIARITTASVTTKQSRMPKDFNVGALLKQAFGRFIGDPSEVVDISVRFSKKVAPIILSRPPQPSEFRTHCRNGDLDVTFSASASGPWRLYHVRSWILSWGADLAVLEPQELKELIRQDVAEMSKRMRVNA
jgi:predicted DNA-binding transcriptional regulator YafY